MHDPTWIWFQVGLPNHPTSWGDLPNPGLIGYFLQVLERIYDEALAGKTQKESDTYGRYHTAARSFAERSFSCMVQTTRIEGCRRYVDHSPPNAVSWTIQLTALS